MNNLILLIEKMMYNFCSIKIKILGGETEYEK
jgi:hypothetical protein